MLSDAEHLKAREEIARLIRQVMDVCKGIRLAERSVQECPFEVEWAVVHDEGGKVEGLSLLYHSENPQAVAAFLRGMLTRKERADADAAGA